MSRHAYLPGLLLAVAASSSAQSTWFVDAAGVAPGSGTASDPYTSIQFALDQPGTQSGDELLIASGTYAESVDFLGKSVIARHDGVGTRPLIVGDGVASAVSFLSGETSDTLLMGVDITGSIPQFPMDQAGGGVLINGASPVLRNVRVRDSAAAVGGGIAILRGRVLLEDCTVEDSESRKGGGIYLEQGVLAIRGGEIKNNETSNSGDGAGIFAAAGTTLRMEDVLVTRNVTFGFGRGGGVFSDGAVDLVRVRFDRNRVGAPFSGAEGGGGIWAPAATGTECHFMFNGGLLTFEGGGAVGGRWTNTLFESNTASNYGGGLDNGVAIDCEFFGNITINEGDVPSGPGGGAARSTLIRCHLEANSTEGFGGGAYQCDLTDCVVRSNRASFIDFGNGGGLDQCTALRCLIEDNWTRASFGGVGGGGASNSTLIQCVIRGNTSQTAGGALSCILDRCTVVHNLATGSFGNFGGGSQNSTVVNSVVWGNAPDQLLGGTQSYSNVQGGAVGLGNIDLDPRFFGPGSDVHLLPNSPCIDAGDPATAADPDGSPADMGAFPFEPLHVREDSTFCAGGLALDLEGTVSASAPGARLVSPDATLYLVAPSAGYSPRVLTAPFSTRPGALCLLGQVLRVPPSAPGELGLSPALLAQLGLAPGDRLFVQAYQPAFSGGNISRGLDVLVQP